MKKRLLTLLLVVALVFVSVPALAAGKKASPSPVYTTPGKSVCLTFDDGYGAKNITRILNTLKKHGVKCTFFVVGDCLNATPALWRRAIKEGHEIAYHSMHHDNLAKRSTSAVAADLAAWNKTAKKVLGKDYRIRKIVRLPYGSGDKRIKNVFISRGYTPVYWSVDPFTGAGRRTASAYSGHILSKVRKNSIILLHFKELDAKALDQCIRKLAAKYPLTTVSQALRL